MLVRKRNVYVFIAFILADAACDFGSVIGLVWPTITVSVWCVFKAFWLDVFRVIMQLG